MENLAYKPRKQSDIIADCLGVAPKDTQVTHKN